jgi:tetratricopeptide (TPR) repeat protein
LEKSHSIFARFDALIAIGLVVLTFAIYLPTLSHGLVDFDDPAYVEQPIVQRGITPEGIRWALTATRDSNWFPVTWLSHMLDAQLYGENWGGQHATSVVLHAINAALVFLLFNFMTGARWRSAIVAGLFAFHPLRVESVSWLAERKDVLCGMFFLLTLLSYAWYVKRRSWKRYLLVVIAFLLALMSKPMAVTLPVILLLLDWWPLARVDPAGSAEADSAARKLALLIEKIPLFVLSAISCVITIVVQRKGGAMNLAGAFTLSQRLENAGVSVMRYLSKTFRPQDLSIYYPLRTSWPIGLVIGSIALIVLMSAVAIALRRRMPFLLVGWFGFLVMLLPVLGIVQVGLQAMADRYTYLPSIFLMLAVVWLISNAASRWKARPMPIALASGVVLCMLMLATWYQQSFWRDTYALFSHALAIDADNSYAHYIVATTLSNAGNDANALPHYERALALDPSDPMFHYRYAGALNRLGQADEAIAQYREAIRLRPDLGMAHYLLAMTLCSKGEFASAEPHFAKAAQLMPDEPKIELGWGQALMAQNRSAEANQHLARGYELQNKPASRD